jgi:ABC-2 type transport system permease protein
VVSAWPSRLSPIGWGQAVQAYSHPTWWPLLPCIGLLLAAAGTAGLVASRRDLGASLLRARPGPATGTTTTALGLAWRLHRSTLLGWGLGAALLGLFAGGLASTATDALGDTAQARRLLASVAPGGRGGLVDLFVTAVVGFGGLLAAAAGSQALVRARSDQVDGRADLVLAAPITRARWLLDWVLVGAACSSTVAVGTGVVAGAAFRAAGEPRFWTSVEVGLAQLPAALVLVGAAALLLVLVPRVSGALTWAVLALAMTLGQLGGLLGLPERVRATSPFAHTPALPFTASDAGPVAGLLLAALALTAAALTAAAWMPGRGAGPRAGPRANRRATGHRPTAVRR